MLTIRPQTIRAVANLKDALAELRQAAREGAAQPAAPGSREERYALQLSRLVRHLTEAIADTPTDLWLTVCNQTAPAKTTTAQAA
jgi:hypothetical protein